MLRGLAPSAAHAQGVSAAGVRGSVSVATGQAEDTRVRVTHDPSGFSVDVPVRGGRFLAQGLEPGGPYTVTARALGFAPSRVTGVFLTLGELREIDFALQPLSTRLDTVPVTAPAGSLGGRAHNDGGVGMTITDDWLEHLPALNRDLYDFARLVPQISTKISLANPGFSAGGVGFRYNNFLINGVSERTLSGGVSGAFAGSKSIPLDAVREYEVLLSPYDVRYGDFAGALVNAVTKSGTNTFSGSVFAYGRNDRLARDDTSGTPYERVQYGFSLGGPIIRNRLHFFVAPELQRYTYPADGPYVGQPSGADQPVPVSVADLERFDALMRGYGLTAGSAGRVENRHPLRNLLARVDLAVPAWNSRVSLWNNYAGGDDLAFSRAARDTFRLSSMAVTRASHARISALHLRSTLGGRADNELLVSQRTDALDPIAPVRQPVIRVAVPGGVTLLSGTSEVAQSGWFRASAWAVKDNLSVAIGGSHVATIGVEVERFRVRRGASAGWYGTWSFPSLDALAAGAPDRYDVRIDFENADAAIHGTAYVAYAGDAWRVTNRLSLTAGLRADLLAIADRPPYEPAVDSIFGRRTDRMPKRRVEPSPRFGFVWDMSDGGRARLRGGVGLFVSRYPLAWEHIALTSYGVGGTLSCNSLGTAARYPPAFVPDAAAPPRACRGGATLTRATPGDVDLLDDDLRMARMARGSLAYDRVLPLGWRFTGEVLATRALSDFALVNLNLPAPAGTDSYGRVMYGTVAPSGVASLRPRSTFTEVIDLRNTGGGRAYELSARIETPPVASFHGSIAYAYSRSRDAETPIRVNTRGTAAWAVARVNAGRDNDFSSIGVSANDIPHRVIFTGAYVAPWTRAPTAVAFYYVGESGRPFTYTAFGPQRRGDLNADGSNANDPIYVPRSALDPNEIAFSGVSDAAGADNTPAAQAARESAQRLAFERFIASRTCLREQRGHIMARNSCREPWSNTTIASVTQAIPIGRRGLEVEFDAYNVVNLLNRGWGLTRQSLPTLLEHVGQTSGPAQSSKPLFRFDPAAPRWSTLGEASVFQMQMGVRYRF